MNDIELIPNNNGWDWNFTNNSVNNVIGEQRIISAIRHAVLLNEYELEQEIYSEEGCASNKYIKLPLNDSTRTLITENIRIVCKKIVGVQDVNVELGEEDGIIIITKIICQLTNGKKVEIDGF